MLHRTHRRGLTVYFGDDGARYRLTWNPWARRFQQPEMLVKPIIANGYGFWEISILAPPSAKLEALINNGDRAFFVTASIRSKHNAA